MKLKMQQFFGWPGVLGAAASALMWKGCATAPEQPAQREYVFYPPPPAEPRYQFLVGFDEEKDLQAGRKSSFASFVIGEEPTSKQIIKPYGLAIHQGKLYVCDTIGFAVDIIDLRTGKMEYWQPLGAGRFRKPVNIWVDQDGTRYVADTGWGVVMVYDANGNYRGRIGEVGQTKATDVVVKGDKVYVADLQNHCVTVYDKATRKPLFGVPHADEKPEGKLFSPVNIAVGEDGKIYVSDFGAFKVKIFDAEGRFLKTVGELGTQIGGMVRPKGIDVDRQGRFYVVDAAAEVVQVFDPEGKLLIFFGEPGTSEVALVLPAKVRIDYDHIELFRPYIAPDFEVEYLVFVTSQYGPRKVSVFAFGHKRTAAPPEQS